MPQAGDDTPDSSVQPVLPVSKNFKTVLWIVFLLVVLFVMVAVGLSVADAMGAFVAKENGAGSETPKKIYDAIDHSWELVRLGFVTIVALIGGRAL